MQTISINKNLNLKQTRNKYIEKTMYLIKVRRLKKSFLVYPATTSDIKILKEICKKINKSRVYLYELLPILIELVL